MALERRESAILGEMLSFVTGSEASEVNCEANAVLQKQCEFLEAKQLQGRYVGWNESKRSHRRRGHSWGRTRDSQGQNAWG